MHLLTIKDGFNITPPVKIEQKSNIRDFENIEDLNAKGTAQMALIDLGAGMVQQTAPHFAYLTAKNHDDEYVPIKESSGSDSVREGSQDEVSGFDLTGMKILKPKVIELLIALYLQNEKKNQLEWSKCKPTLLTFFIKETSRLEKLVSFDSIPEDYHNYLFDYVLVFAYKYAEKILSQTSSKSRREDISEQIIKIIQLLADRISIFIERLSIGQTKIFKQLLVIGIDESKSLNIIEKLDQKIRHITTEEKHRNRKKNGMELGVKARKSFSSKSIESERSEASSLWKAAKDDFLESKIYKKVKSFLIFKNETHPLFLKL